MIVIDASALIHLLLASEAGRRVAARLGDETLHAPHLVDVETTQAVRRLLLAGEISEQRAAVTMGALAQLDLHRYPHDSLLERIWELRHNLTAYDAAYVSLAEVLDCPLITSDGRLARAPGLGGRAELLE